MGVKITNNASATLAASITNSATTLTVTSGQGASFPTLTGVDYCWLTLVDTSNNVEVVKCTARSTDSFTIVRAQDNTTARAFAINDRLELRPTAALFDEFANPLSEKGVDIASASPLVITAGSDYFDVTGTTNFSAMTVATNRQFTLQFDGALTMTHHATNLDLPGEANITTAAGDVATFQSTGANTVQCINYTKANGEAVVGSLADNSVTLAKMASGTDGNVISYDASGNPVAVATGSAGQVLTSAGAGAPPTFAAVAGGKILQVVATHVTAISSYAAANSTWYDVTGLTATITPAATSSKILVIVQCGYGVNPHNQGVLMKVLRGGSEIDYRGDADDTRSRVITGNEDNNLTYGLNQANGSFVDSPSSTSALAYKVQLRIESTGYGILLVNRAGQGGDSPHLPNGASSIILMEIGA